MSYLNVPALIITILLLLMLLRMLSVKLYVYFDTFAFLAKKENFDKTNYIANSSYFKYFYNNKQKFWGNLSIEQLLTLTMILLSIVAYIGFVVTGHKNWGFLNYYYGDSTEYYFVNIFINIIIILAIIYTLIYVYWGVIEKGEDDKLEDNEILLKKFITENCLCYEYLYYYYLTTVINNQKIYNINNFITDANTKEEIDVKYFDEDANIFKLCFTNELLNEKGIPKYDKIKTGILDRIHTISDDITIKSNDIYLKKIEKIEKLFSIKDNNILQDFYIIANYNHNNNIALPPLSVMIDNLNTNITNSNNNNDISRFKTKLETIKKNGSNTMSDLNNDFSEIFRNTIQIYKTVYDKYSTYYMGSVLITNFVILYAVLIFIYIFIKLGNLNKSFADSSYNIYNFRSDLMNYATFILIIYLFISCPIIIFGFN